MADIMNESVRIRHSIKKIVKEVIAEETKECLRLFKAEVITAPNGSTCEIQLVGDKKTMNLPYSSKVSSVKKGSMVWVVTIYNSFSNAIVWETINFQ